MTQWVDIGEIFDLSLLFCVLDAQNDAAHSYEI
jgi:hypothetical protein